MADKRWWSLLGLLFVLSLVLRHEMLFLFAILLTLASGASVLWFRYCLHGVTYKRRLKDERIFGGEETELTIDVVNAKPLPLPWLLIRDRFPKEITLLTGALDGAQQREAAAQQQETSVLNLTDLLALRWYERVQRTYRVRGEQRGAFTFGPAAITAGDIFGFGRKQAHIETTDRLIVYPRIVPIDRLGLPAERPSGEMKALRRVIEDPLRMATVREYVPGDSIRHIHWKNTARLNQLQTKVFDPSSTPVLALFVDLQTVHNPYGLITEYLELGICAAASIAIHALDLRHAVGVYANGGPRGANNWTMIPPGRSPGQGSQILEALAPLFGFRLIPLYQLLRRLMPSLPYGCTVVAISAQATEALLSSLLTLQDAGHPVVLLTVGDDRPEIPDTFATHHLGGRDAWRRLETLELA
jgi:uncharacterized protein (DUF58 family)